MSQTSGSPSPTMRKTDVARSLGMKALYFTRPDSRLNQDLLHRNRAIGSSGRSAIVSRVSLNA
jgi:hypothetical protein